MKREIVAYKIWRCSLCKETFELKESITDHLHKEHGIRGLEVFNSMVWKSI